MNSLITVQTTPWFDRFLWAAGHSLWQGALAAALVWVTGRFISSARTKHNLVWTAMACLVILFAANFAIAPAMTVSVNPPVQDSLEIGAMAAAMWIATFSALAVLIGMRYAGLRRLIRRAGPVSLEVNQSLVEAASLAAGTNGRPNAMICAAISTPAAVHDRILIPPDCVGTLDQRELASVIAHELAHLKRGDFWLNLAQNALEAALIFNPFAWYLSARIRVEREHCCDDDAVAATGDPVAYGRALAKLSIGRELQPALALAMADAKVSHRIRRLSAPRRTEKGGVWVPSLCAAISVAAFALLAKNQSRPFEFTTAQPKEIFLRVVNFEDRESSHVEQKGVFITESSASSSAQSSQSSTFTFESSY